MRVSRSESQIRGLHQSKLKPSTSGKPNLNQKTVHESIFKETQTYRSKIDQRVIRSDPKYSRPEQNDNTNADSSVQKSHNTSLESMLKS